MVIRTTNVSDTARLRGLEADHLQEIEGNPLTVEEHTMFEMFEHEGWTPEQQRAYVLAQFEANTAPHAAE